MPEINANWTLILLHWGFKTFSQYILVILYLCVRFKSKHIISKYYNIMYLCTVFSIRNGNIIRTIFRKKWVCAILLLLVISGINHMADTFAPTETSISSLSAKNSGGPLHF